MTTFQDILDTQSGSVAKPKTLPNGTYHVMVEGLPQIKNVGQNDRQIASLRLKVLGAREDVDQTELSELDGYQGRTVFYTIWLSGEDISRVKWDFKNVVVNGFGVDDNNGTKSFREMLQDLAGKQALAYVRRKPDKTGEDFVNEVGKITAL